MFPAWDPTALCLVAPMRGIANLRSQPPHRGILRISPTNILLTLKEGHGIKQLCSYMVIAPEPIKRIGLISFS